jgi:membrane associated rhomboid family serine protease
MLNLTNVDVYREFICSHCEKRLSIEDEGKDPTELQRLKQDRTRGRLRTVLFVVTLFSGLMGGVIAGQANEILEDSQQLNNIAFGGLSAVIGAAVAVIIQLKFHDNHQKIRAAAFLAFGAVAAANLGLLTYVGLPSDSALNTQLWALSAFWLISGSLMIVIGSRRPKLLDLAPKAENS